MNWLVLKNVAKYLIHGFLPALFFLALPFGWYPFLMLIILRSVFALPLVLVVWILILGVVNNALTSFIWFSVKFSFWKILVQGFIMFVIILILSAIISSWSIRIHWLQFFNAVLFTDAVRTGLVLLIGSLILGWVGKNIVLWQVRRKQGSN